MATTIINTDTICDLQGKPLQPAIVTLITSLDKLLTVGGYYSSEHEQYRNEAQRACANIVRVIGGKSKYVAIEITAQGVMIGNQSIDPGHRKVRLLHDLLVPLNIARLKISGSLSPDDLCRGIAALQGHKVTLGQSNTFHEIIFDNLPPSVQVESCSVLQQSENEPDLLARKFLDMVSEILESLEKMDRELGIKATHGPDGASVTVEDLKNLKQAMRKLVEYQPDPAELADLITQAQRALDLSKDSKSVDLVFNILKKTAEKKKAAKPAAKPPKPRKAEYKLTVEELHTAVQELEKIKVPVTEPLAGSQSNKLCICLHLLRADPAHAQAEDVFGGIEQVVVHPDFSAEYLMLCAMVFDTIIREDGLEILDDMLPPFVRLIRKKRPEMLASFWSHLVDLLDGEYLPELWPHLVNDILLGVNGKNPEMAAQLVSVVCKISEPEAKELKLRLKNQPALQRKSARRDIFMAPLEELHPLLVVLADSPLSGWVAAELHRVLRSRSGLPLLEVLLTAWGKYRPKFISFYLEVARHFGEDQLSTEAREFAVGTLKGMLGVVSPQGRHEAWIPRGLAELGKWDPDGSRSLLERVKNERKHIFFKAWPEPARKAAAKALASCHRTVR